MNRTRRLDPSEALETADGSSELQLRVEDWRASCVARAPSSGPTLALVLEGEGAIATCRRTIGATDPAQADPGSLRGDFALAMPDNLVHGSDSPESAAREIAIWFPDGLV